MQTTIVPPYVIVEYNNYITAWHVGNARQAHFEWRFFKSSRLVGYSSNGVIIGALFGERVEIYDGKGRKISTFPLPIQFGSHGGAGFVLLSQRAVIIDTWHIRIYSLDGEVEKCVTRKKGLRILSRKAVSNGQCAALLVYDVEAEEKVVYFFDDVGDIEVVPGDGVASINPPMVFRHQGEIINIVDTNGMTRLTIFPPDDKSVIFAGDVIAIAQGWSWQNKPARIITMWEYGQTDYPIAVGICERVCELIVSEKVVYAICSWFDSEDSIVGVWNLEERTFGGFATTPSLQKKREMTSANKELLRIRAGGRGNDIKMIYPEDSLEWLSVYTCPEWEQYRKWGEIAGVRLPRLPKISMGHSNR